ncbi:hypothetical protein BC937DRAFT_94512 [Endogone sp. FLAS-F59071]|nr:hypothetical protein BC937DRAFT_94512 [Endogone sp. FLAS-F59071]|eukprot:RUS13987.1 hypothetical protein BC937DRAFT_94512 [Endogone sp. FLAS-F59071]
MSCSISLCRSVRECTLGTAGGWGGIFKPSILSILSILYSSLALHSSLDRSDSTTFVLGSSFACSTSAALDLDSRSNSAAFILTLSFARSNSSIFSLSTATKDVSGFVANKEECTGPSALSSSSSLSTSISTIPSSPNSDFPPQSTLQPSDPTNSSHLDPNPGLLHSCTSLTSPRTSLTLSSVSSIFSSSP